MWRMKTFDLDIEDICYTFIKEIRSLLELAVTVCHIGLTVKQSRNIERIQKFALYIILGDNYLSYVIACTLMNIEPLNVKQ